MTYQEKDLQYVLHTYKRNPICFERGKGAVLYAGDADYIDFMAGIAVCSVGHGNAKLAEALYDQALKLIHVSNLYGIPNQAELAERIVRLSGLDARVFFCNSGAEANEAAIKIARKNGEAQKRFKIITLRQSFHGRTIATLKATGQEKMHTHFAPYPDGFVHADNLAHVQQLLDDQTAAVLLELIKGEGGIECLDKSGMHALAKTLKEHGILLMVDEVQSGIYRSGEFLASNLYGLQPDVVTLAKGLAGGVPIGAVLTTQKDIFAPGEHGSTFGGNPLATRAALCVLGLLQDEHDSKRLAQRIELFWQNLAQMCAKFPQLFARSVGIGLMCGLQCVREEQQARVIDKSFAHRVLVLRSGADVVRFVPPLTISEGEIREGFARFSAACAEIVAES